MRSFTQEKSINLVIGVCKLAELFLIYLLAINKYAVGGLMLVNFILYINASYQIASSISEIVWTVSVLYTASIYYEDFNKYTIANVVPLGT